LRTLESHQVDSSGLQRISSSVHEREDKLEKLQKLLAADEAAVAKLQGENQSVCV